MGRETNRQRRERQAASARERAAAARVEARRAEQRRRATTVLGIVVSVAIVGALIVALVIKTASHQTNSRTAASSQVLGNVIGVTQATWNGVGAGSTSVLVKPTKSTDPPLTSGGKPELLYIGGEFCPHCAAERWALVQALSRFGTFKGLSEIRSASTDGNIATFSFYKSSYTSKYVAFTPIEAEDRNQDRLEPVSKAEGKVFTEYTQGSFPFIDFGGKYVQTLAGIDYNILSGKTQAQIAQALTDPASTIAKAVIGEANNITATLCTLTGNAPANVCGASSISGLQAQIANA